MATKAELTKEEGGKGQWVDDRGFILERALLRSELREGTVGGDELKKKKTGKSIIYKLLKIFSI